MTELIERTPRRRFLQALTTFPAVASLEAFEPARLHAAAQAVSGLSDDEVARDERFWFSVQQAFSLDARHVILNAGASDPMPRSVLEAVIRHTEFTNASPLVNGRVVSSEREQVRQRLARHVGCDPEEIAMTRGTTEGLNIVISGLGLDRADACCALQSCQ
jgi:selenocysteine lyase/cysteine desulfurase